MSPSLVSEQVCWYEQQCVRIGPSYDKLQTETGN